VRGAVARLYRGALVQKVLVDHASDKEPDRVPDELSHGATTSVSIQTRTDGDAARARLDEVAVEAPLEVRFGGRAGTVLMRTPGNDEELVRGFLFGEGLISQASDIVSMTRPADVAESLRGNVIDVQFAPTRRVRGLDRSFVSNSSCGVCGKRTIASLDIHAGAIDSRILVNRRVLAELPARLKASQPTFARTGGVHASGLFTPSGELVALREDVGRHNALDKLIGWVLGAGEIPLTEYLLLLSGRVSYELVQKAVVASIPLIAAVGAPSSLAVELAERFNITLVGFLHPHSMNVYAHGSRVVE
jgi:FdhD protein